ncbi:MAG: hypothetical protein IKN16_06310 [Selenomonadaceae bacterium]|nr:hypothetical protein [Selenomonadaceae bacterium]MBR6888043.1 hypothetical protein [Selenomonadaceae bacterium]
MFKQNRKVAVVIPIYKEELNEFEKISLAQCRKILGKYQFAFVAPKGKNFSYLETGDMLVQFSPLFFQSVETYNRLMMSPQFYEPFLDFDYILIYQLDAFVFYDALEFFCDLGYDYIGAPVAYHSWYTCTEKRIPRVGNGGFSLRKVRICHKLLTECVAFPEWQFFLDNFFEDAFFGLCGVRDDVKFNTAPFLVALCFAVDYFPDRFLRRIGNKIPFGCHSWPNCSADAYVELFRRAGYDLSPLRAKMGNKDYDLAFPLSMEYVAIKRLVRGIKRGQSVLQYLPTKKFASVRVVRNLDAMKILAGMIQEDCPFTDKIFFYDREEGSKIVRDITRENLPHLVLSTYYDESLIKQIEERGLIYSEHVISFRQEYIKHCEKIFRNLGK